VTTLLADRGLRLEGFEPSAGPTLEHVISRVCEELARDDAAVCPVCAGEMSRPLGDSPLGVCSTCGSELA
jgi:hypothetical protein